MLIWKRSKQKKQDGWNGDFVGRKEVKEGKLTTCNRMSWNEHLETRKNSWKIFKRQQKYILAELKNRIEGKSKEISQKQRN